MGSYTPTPEHENLMNRHFDRVDETSEVIWKILEKSLNKFYARNDGNLSKHMEVFISKRRNHKRLLRPYMARLAFEMCGGKNWEDYAPVWAAMEMFNISTYQSNICFDDKVNLQHASTSQSNQFISSMLAMSIANELIHDSNISGSAKLQAIQLLSECNKKVYLGQYADINNLSISRFLEKEGTFDKKSFSKAYIERCRNIGGSTFEVTAIGGIISGGENDKVEKIRKLFNSIGAVLQIINDLADYIPSREYFASTETVRPYTNSYGDLRMGRLTFPTYMLLSDNNCSAKAVRVYRQWEVLAPAHTELEELTRILRNHLKIRGKTESFIRRHLWSEIEDMLATLNCTLSDSQINDLSFFRKLVFGSWLLRSFSKE